MRGKIKFVRFQKKVGKRLKTCALETRKMEQLKAVSFWPDFTQSNLFRVAKPKKKKKQKRCGISTKIQKWPKTTRVPWTLGRGMIFWGMFHFCQTLLNLIEPKVSTVVRHWGNSGPRPRRFLLQVFFFSRGICHCGPGLPLLWSGFHFRLC